jgi:tetratricopeptide (TPR) repeat protein
VASRGYQPRRADASCVHRRCGLPRRGHASPPQGRLGEGALADRTLDHCGSDGNVVLHLPWAVASSAWAGAQLYEASKALHRVQEGEQLFERQTVRGIVAFRAWAYHALGRACLLLGQLDEARRLVDRAVQSSRVTRGSWPILCTCSATSRPIPIGSMPSAPRPTTGKSLALAEPRGMRPLIAHCHLGLGKLYRHAGKREQAHEYLTAATTMYGEMDMQLWLERAEAETRQLL